MIHKIAAAFSATALATLSAAAQGANIDYDKIQIITQKLAPDFYALTGSPDLDPGHPEAAGGRVGVLIGPDGVFMVDGTYAPLSSKVLEAIRKQNSGPIRFLVDTHYHPDHTGGNPNFARMGAIIFAREETRKRLIQPLPPAVATVVGKAASWTDPSRLPTVTYGMGSPRKIYFDSETIDIIPLPPAHTDGDTMVRFEKADIVMAGDFFRTYGYPFVDATNGGSFKGTLEAIRLLLQVAGPNTKIVPGHGRIATRADVEAYRDMILDVQSHITKMMHGGKSLPDILAAKLTRPYDAKVPGGTVPLPIGVGTSADRFVSGLYTELKSGK
jgi:glyoxylase-like metal-dependent hydrolase (beta-lactamase superfamily II)